MQIRRPHRSNLNWWHTRQQSGRTDTAAAAVTADYRGGVFGGAGVDSDFERRCGEKSAVFEIDLFVVVVYISPFAILCEARYVKIPLGFLNDKRWCQHTCA